MISLPPDDPLVALWHTAPEPDTRHLLRDLQHSNRLHQQLNRIILAILIGFSLLLIFEEATGRLATHGMVSAIWTLGMAIGVVRHRRTGCIRADAFTLDTVRLLKFMIERAKRDLLIARWLYAGVPCGAVVGYLVTAAIRTGTAPPMGGHPYLHMIQTGAGAAALIIMIVTGAILSRSRRLQVREFSEKLRAIEDEL